MADRPVPHARPAPGEELNDGPETPPRPAASVIVLRDATEGPEVLLVQRNPEQRFMGGAWVFPGGAIAPGEDPAETAVRELAEEAALTVPDASGLVAFSRWVTPAEIKIRFDTYFFVARAPDGAEAAPDGAECVDAAWLRPQDALDAHGRDELQLVFPTIRHLEDVAAFAAVEEALDFARRREVEPVVPRVVSREGRIAVIMPGEPEYDA